MTKKVKKENLWLPTDFNMFDTCWCHCNCACPCGRNLQLRKPSSEVIYGETMADFSEVCNHYVENKPKYVLCKQYPVVDSTRPQERNRGWWIDKEIELTEKELFIINYLIHIPYDRSGMTLQDQNDCYVIVDKIIKKIRKVLSNE